MDSPTKLKLRSSHYGYQDQVFKLRSSHYGYQDQVFKFNNIQQKSFDIVKMSKGCVHNYKTGKLCVSF